ncbi:alkaline phosphatase family protein [Natronobeatus ordinarius]|uniref:alkaline phosphatase family protein n=1 Tax=Natronobeatus ordinarius TaxID=2963433 RepID=UPI0020CEB0FC|nr:alkaline phosphatase family protein [Natronobeatus ordinarius]
MKTVVLGFDALDVRYLDRYASSLPNLTALRDRGIEAPLESTHPPWTGSAWPSMYTGVDPSYHGVYDFFDYDGYPDEGRLVSRADVRQPAIWNYLSAEGIASIVSNVPITHPAEPIEGVLVPGYLAAEDEPGHPEGIRDELSSAIGEAYTVYSSGELSSDSDEKFAGYLELLDRRRRAARWLLESHDWEFAFFQLQKTDAVFHNFDDDDHFRVIYEAADRLVGDVLEVVDEETNVIVCSDHGIGPVTGYQIHVNEVLAEHGLVEATDETDDGLWLGPEKAALMGETGADTETEPDSAGRSPLERTVLAGSRVASGLGIEPGHVYGVAERFGLESALVRLAPDVVREVAGKSVDWRASRAYCPSKTQLGVRINLAGREPEGIVSPDEYEAVRDDVIELLAGLETPDGEPAFEFVCRREAVFDGPYAEDAPDVLFRPAGMVHTVSTKLYGQRFVPVDDHDHQVDGVFLGVGPGFADGYEADRLSLTDVAPVTMALLGRPVPSRMTGTVPDGLLDEPVDRAEYGDVPYATGAAPEDDEDDVTERLEDLGYL